MKIDKESFVLGIFFGALLICLFMLNYPKPTKCSVMVAYANKTFVTYGVIKDDELQRSLER